MVTLTVRVTLPPLPSSSVEGERLDLGLGPRPDIRLPRRHAVVPGDHAAQAGAGGVGGDARRQAAERPRRGRDRADAVDVGQVDVGKGDRPGIGEIADRA